MTPKILTATTVLLLLSSLEYSDQQSVLFPHGYFDSNKISAVDAFYLHMLAVASLENGGTTEQELDDLAASRKQLLPEEPDLTATGQNSAKIGDPKIDELSAEEVDTFFGKEKPLTRDNRPPAPFDARVLHDDAGEDDDSFNPFEDISTRAPPTVAPVHRLLNRNQILGVSPQRPRHHFRDEGAPKNGEKRQKKRKPYIDIDLSKPQIVRLPLPPQ